MRQVQYHDAAVTDAVLEAFETCVQCRGCEPACPSSVPYGHLMEQVRETLAEEGLITPAWRRWLFRPLTMPSLLRLGAVGAAVGQRLRLLPSRLGLSQKIPLRRHPLSTTGDDVYLFTGCVMDVLQRDVHQAAMDVLAAAGIGAIPTDDLAPCCGALHTHAGLGTEARRMAMEMMERLDPERPIVVDSAGCGAAMKDYGHLLGTPEAKAFASRVHDIHEFLADHIDALPEVEPIPQRVAIQDPCHLRHVQRVHEATRTVLAPFVADLVELADDGLCCGAGGAYSVFEPELAGAIRDRKVDVIEGVHPDVVASANPGCALHLAAAGVATRHPIQLVAEALRG